MFPSAVTVVSSFFWSAMLDWIPEARARTAGLQAVEEVEFNAAALSIVATSRMVVVGAERARVLRRDISRVDECIFAVCWLGV